jgi:hypothetical protein
MMSAPEAAGIAHRLFIQVRMAFMACAFLGFGVLWLAAAADSVAGDPAHRQKAATRAL